TSALAHAHALTGALAIGVGDRALAIAFTTAGTLAGCGDLELTGALAAAFALQVGRGVFADQCGFRFAGGLDRSIDLTGAFAANLDRAGIDIDITLGGRLGRDF